ncbi:MAG: SDR family oxidoreductase [Deltaproteobacteria bacterium]|nr:SDR family oxidoreductase [Deltaproteobacteria bacterium]
MEISTKGLRVLITASASGIGFAVAKAFQDTGASVHICDVSNTQLDTCRQTLPGAGISCVDISSPAEVDSLFEDVLSHLGGLDVLVNNAGIAGPTAPIEAVDPEDWDRTMAVNINGQFYCARKAVPLLKEAGGGSIINMSSSAGIMGYPFRSPYAASKWAVIGLTKTMAMELGEFNVRVNAVCPNAVEGPRMDAVIEAEAKVKGITEEEVYACLVQGTSMRTFVTAEDVSNMILFLCSDAGKRISGQALSVDGFTETLR